MSDTATRRSNHKRVNNSITRRRYNQPSTSPAGRPHTPTLTSVGVSGFCISYPVLRSADWRFKWHACSERWQHNITEIETDEAQQPPCCPSSPVYSRSQVTGHVRLAPSVTKLYINTCFTGVLVGFLLNTPYNTLTTSQRLHGVYAQFIASPANSMA